MGGFSNDRLASWCSYLFGKIQISSEYYSGGIGISLCFKTETTNYSQYVGIFIVD